MVSNPYLLLTIAIVAEVIGTSLLPVTHGFNKLVPTLVVLACYGVAFYLLSVTVETLPVGIVYAIWASSGIVLTTLVAWLVYKQSLDLPAIFGMMLIIAGVVCIQLFSKVNGH